MRSVVAVVLATLLGLAASAFAEPLPCQRTILKESARMARTRIKVRQRCEDRKRAGALPAATNCGAEPTTVGKLAKAESKLRAALAGTCGGADHTCGTADDETPAAIGWPAACPDFEARGCTNAIAGCDDVADCLACVDDAAVDQAVALAYGHLKSPAASALERCQRAIGKEMTRFFDAKLKALVKCWDARHKGQHANPCPIPGDGKAGPTIAKAQSKLRTKLCRACGGSDRACGGTPDLTPAAIGFPSACPAVAGCGGAVGDLDALVGCVDCITEFKVDCLTPLAVPALAPYPAACSEPINCPTVLQLDGDGDSVDLDVGWNGFAHDQRGPWLERLTLAVLGCAGNGAPTCGECTLVGPIDNAGGAAFANQRCADRTWVPCTGDGDCVAAGAVGPCRFFLGPPQPVGIGGILTCALSEITGPITGTLDVETGALAAPLPLVMHHYNSIILLPGDPPSAAVPCPRCIAGTCDDGPRLGMPCTVQGESEAFAADVSLDCPPADEEGRIPMVVPLSTETQTRTLSATSPPCSAAGVTTYRCACSTCNNAAANPCGTDGDCPESPPGTPGVCGGRRCLPPSTNLGAPCTAASQCMGGPCSLPQEPTAPNACLDTTCTTTVGDEGECAAGPFDGYCGPAEPYRGCLAATDCPVPGDVCVFRARECFTDSGTIGMSVAAFAAADPPIAGFFTPSLAGLFCIGRVSPPPSFDNPPRGLPGLGRVEIDVAATLQ